MSKIFKNCYFTRSGEKRINCYYINLSKEVVEKALINEKDELNVHSENGKIIIEKIQKKD